MTDPLMVRKQIFILKDVVVISSEECVRNH